jgi:hypothetical protein
MGVFVQQQSLKNVHRSLSLLLLILFLSLPALIPEKARACACCASWGDWFERKERLLKYQLDILNELKFSKAKIYFSDVYSKGLAISNTDETANVSLSRVRGIWKMAFKTNSGRQGTLTFSLPPAATMFGADPRDGQQGGGGGPILYKEVRLEGPVKGTGIFAKGMKPDTKYRLVLQGRGNMCMDAQDFKTWVLQISGKFADFSFYGDF